MPFFLRGRGQKDDKPKKKKLVKNQQPAKQTGFAPSYKKQKETANKRDNEEITSDEDEEFMNQFKKKKEETIEYLEKEEETAQEKKVRLAKEYLNEIKRQKEEEFEDDDLHSDLHEAVGLKLRQDVLEAAGRLQKAVAESVVLPDQSDIMFLRSKHHKLSLTCLTVSNDEKFIFTASKDSNIVKWNRAGEKLGVIVGGKKGKEKTTDCHATHIFCLAISTDGKFLASGDASGAIRIWDPSTLTHLKQFNKHRDTISGLAFRRGTHFLFSASHDRMVMLWDLDSMAFVENMGGHQDAITGIDALYRESCITCGGRDESVIINILAEEKQLRFHTRQESIDGVKLLNERTFITYGQDGSIAAWIASKRKPQHIVRNAHGVDPLNRVPYWVTALATLTNTDLIASGSLDGFINLWKIDKSTQKLSKIHQIPMLGVVNGLEFTPSGSHLMAIVGKEHKLGRWFSMKSVKNALVIIPLGKNSE